MFGIDLEELIRTTGYLGIFAIVFAESGLLVGFFLPGDSLLFTAGFLASQGVFSFPALLLGCFVMAVAGDSVGYLFGYRVGRRLFQRDDSRFFHKKNLVRTQLMYEKYGAKIIVMARFMPIVRTFAPVVAGIGTMHYRTFVTYNIVGGFLWAVDVTSAGYFLGSAVPNVDHYLLPIIALIIIVSVLPPAWHLWKERKEMLSEGSGEIESAPAASD